jgi:hypothetical protein
MDNDARRELAAERRRKLVAKRWDQMEARDRQREIEARYVLEVTLAHDEEGKRAYPNERVRCAAVTLRLAADEEYTALRARIRLLDAEAAEIAREVHDLSYRGGLGLGFFDRGP